MMIDKRFTTIVTPEQYSKIERIAETHNLGIATVVRLIIAEKLEEVEEGKSDIRLKVKRL